MNNIQRLNHHHLYIFWVFARVGSFTGTARELSIAQSAVTLQLKQLEETLGLALIDRTQRRRPELTSDGYRVLDYANLIFEASEELVRWSARGEAPERAVIRVGALSGLSRNLQFEFLKPVVNDDSIKVDVTTGDQEKLIRLLRDHQLDVVLSSHNVSGDGKVSFYSHVLTSSSVVFVMKPEKALKREDSLREVLERRSLYVPGLGFEVRPELDAYLGGLKVPLRLAGEIDDIALLRIFALRSGCVVAVPEMGVRDDIQQKNLRVVARISNIQQRFYAITRKKKVPSKIIERLILSLRDV